MSRAFYINGESMILVKGRSDSSIGTLSQLGMTSEPIRVQQDYKHLQIGVDAYGEVPPDLQGMGMMARVDMTLVHFDSTVLAACVSEAIVAPAEGQLGHAGALLGNGAVRFAPGILTGNKLIGLNIQSAIGAQPWRFLYTALLGQPLVWPLGAARSLVQVSFVAIPYSADPWNAGQGSYGVTLFDHTLDV